MEAVSDIPRTREIIAYIEQQFPAAVGHIPLTEKIGQLERELNQVLGSPSLRVSAEIAKARNAEIEQLRARLAELEKDKARLDWLDGQNVHMDIIPDDSNKVTLDVIVDEFCKTYERVTLRQAIDAAMKGQP